MFPVPCLRHTTLVIAHAPTKPRNSYIGQPTAQFRCKQHSISQHLRSALGTYAPDHLHISVPPGSLEAVSQCKGLGPLSSTTPTRLLLCSKHL